MTKFLSLIIALIGFSIALDVDARRMGGGKNVGQQREMNQTQPRTPPSQQQAAPAQQQAAKGPVQQPQSGMSRWLGPLAGLAIGAALASLFFNNGMGGFLMFALVLAAIAFGIVMLVRMFRGRTAQQPLQYAAQTPSAAPAPAPVAAPQNEGMSYRSEPSSGGAPAPHSLAAKLGGGPAAPAEADAFAGFDRDQFLQHARSNFISLQAAHDRRDLSSIRGFLTPALYREIEADVAASGDAPQTTEIVTLNAEIADTVVENGQYVVSVRFSGLIREERGAEAQPFSEIWHLEKPMSGLSGWMVSGIQQA